MELDVVIFGGGCAGLWLVDALAERGYTALVLEAGRLGDGQTVSSQGIIHGGLKYTLDGLLTPSAEDICEMPMVWRECLRGRRRPDLGGTRVVADFCHLWRTKALRSRLGMVGARLGLRVKPTKLDRHDWPVPLRGCPGDVHRLDEQVIDPVSLIHCLANWHRERVLRIDSERGLEFVLVEPHLVKVIRLRHPDADGSIELRPRAVVFTAGEGNAALRRRVGLSAEAMQRRPLHMVMVRGALPVLNGHCTDAAATRVTITTARDSSGRIVWQVGGQVAEDGVTKDEHQLAAFARRELETVLPGVDFGGLEWATYRIDRAEGAMPGGKRPSNVQAYRDGNVVTAWPTKLALAPRLAERVCGLLDPPRGIDPAKGGPIADWPQPATAQPPWEIERTWIVDI
ncbi:MAG: FAD-dependent oxidoreductase [Phycisphaerae bacterium]|nr:FAD-dependent oxidoreductase [Phycisphaerae bacterium]